MEPAKCSEGGEAEREKLNSNRTLTAPFLFSAAHTVTLFPISNHCRRLFRSAAPAETGIVRNRRRCLGSRIIHSLLITSLLQTPNATIPPIPYSPMSLRAASPPPRATTPEPALHPLPSPRLRPSRSFGRLGQTTSTSLSSHDEFRLTFDEFGAGRRTLHLKVSEFFDTYHSFAEASSSKPPTSPGRTRRRSGPTAPSLQNHVHHHHKAPRRPGSPPPPALHHSTPPPPLPPLPSFLISVARKSSKGNGFDMSGTSIFPSKPFSASPNESANSRCYPFHRSSN